MSVPGGCVGPGQDTKPVFVSRKSGGSARWCGQWSEWYEFAGVLLLLRRLCERQTRSGGLNGRPEKLQDVSVHMCACSWAKEVSVCDCCRLTGCVYKLLTGPCVWVCGVRLQVCYSWWCLSCLSILDRLHWIDQQALTQFILYCQVCCGLGMRE